MFGVNQKRRRGKKLAKTTVPPIPLPMPAPVYAQPQLNISLPPPYILLCPHGHSPSPQQLPPPPPPPPPPPQRPIPAPVIRLKSPTSRPAGFSKSRKNPTALCVSSTSNSSHATRPLHVSNKPFENRQEDAGKPMADKVLSDLITSKFDSVITSIDGEVFSGDIEDLEIKNEGQSGLRGGWGSTSREVSRRADKAISSAITSTNYFSKVNLYANSKLPPNLPPLTLYFPSYPLICLAAQYSQRAYTKPSGKEREAFVDANWRGGTKAMVIKSVPIDDMNCVVFAIRGSQTFMDWAVNLNSAPVSPTDFLDDPGNLCHSGFLHVARKMIKPVAARLRSLLEEDPSRSTCSLLMTGHSAGGAIASLLYAHMLAEVTKSELNILTGCFKRIHCLTFGTPPVSLLPLTKPPTLRHKKSLFLSFINEGDPVPRADKAYIRSLLNLYASPAPGTNCIAAPLLKPCRNTRPKPQKANSAPALPAPTYIWEVPPGTLSNAGRLVALRDHQNAGAEPTNDVKAEVTTDEQLRGVVFGDPVMHMMKVYAKRVEVLATKAVTARIWG